MTAAIVNINVGILGHVDSGKTSLAKALSKVASTAAFDKNPQSRARGITLDLGFSALTLDPPAHFAEHGCNQVQVTLVDCPGHASLIRTIIGGAQIIDTILLVVDAAKGIQTQTAECLVIGEVTCRHMIVVLNKTDLYPPDQRQAKIDKMCAGLRKTLSTTRFAGAPIVPVAANVGSRDDGQPHETNGLHDLLEALRATMPWPDRTTEGNFLFAVDHCFAIRGQGTVMTGTVLKGTVAVGDTIELPAMHAQRKVKSMQMFHQPVQQAIQGDRVGICVTQFDASTLERGIVAKPQSVPIIHGGIARVTKIRFFKFPCQSRTKFHVTIGHETVLGTAIFFDTPSSKTTNQGTGLVFDFSNIYPWQDELTAVATSVDQTQFQWALLQFDHPVPCPLGSVIIASRLDVSQGANTCRLSFHGHMSDVVFTSDTYKDTILPQLQVYKTKERTGTIDRVHDSTTIIGKGLFKKDSKIELYLGMKVLLSTGEVGQIESSFGQSAKFRVVFRQGVPEHVKQLFAKPGSARKKGAAPDDDTSGDSSSATPREVPQIILKFNRFVFDKSKRMVQSTNAS